jgi:hypothetical protein
VSYFVRCRIQQSKGNADGNGLTSRISTAKGSSQQAKKIVIPAFISMSSLSSFFWNIVVSYKRCQERNAALWRVEESRTNVVADSPVIPIWMACSISVILYNSESCHLFALPVYLALEDVGAKHGQSKKSSELIAEYVFSSLNFPFPVFLTTFHLTFSVSQPVVSRCTST